MLTRMDTRVVVAVVGLTYRVGGEVSDLTRRQ